MTRMRDRVIDQGVGRVKKTPKSDRAFQRRVQAIAI